MSSDPISSDHTVSSPSATGGIGTIFEEHTGAVFLGLLLIRGYLPILTECVVEEVHFQTEHLGYQTDDLLVIGRTEAGTKRSLLVQAKRTFTVSDKNDECVKAISDFWADFKASSPFDPETDRFALVTQFGTTTLLKQFTSLLDAARASISAEDYLNRIAAYLHKTAQRQAVAVRAILDKAAGASISDDEFWQFLKLIHVNSFDLATSTSQTEAWVRTLLATTTNQQNGVANATATWKALVELAGRSMGNAESYTHEKLPEELRQRHQGNMADIRAAVQAIHDHSATVTKSIETTVAGSYHIPREGLATQLLEHLEESRVLIVTGPAGYGKSVMARGAIDLLQEDHLVFAFRVEEFGVAHMDMFLRNAQVNLTATRLFSALAGQGRKYLFIESVERLLEKSVREAFTQLLAIIQEDPTWRLVMTCRDYSIDTVRSSFLKHANLSHTVFNIPLLSDAELDSAAAAIPQLARAASSDRLRPLLRIPYVMDKAASMDWPEDQPIPNSERDFRRKFWREIVRNEAHTSNRLPSRREQTLIELSLRRAQTLSLYAPCEDLDTEAVSNLRNDGLVTYSEGGDSLAAPSHDVLEDWSNLVWIEKRFELHERDVSQIASDIGGYPALRRAYRRWLADILESDSENADAVVLSVVGDASLPAHFRDDTILSALQSSSADSFVERNKDALLADGASLFRRVIHLLRVACKTTPPWLPFGQKLPPLFFVPDGVAWPAVLRVLADHLNTFLPQDARLLLGLVEDWAHAVAWWQPHPPGEADAGRVAYAALSCFVSYQDREEEQRAMKVILKIPAAVPEQFLSLVKSASTDERPEHRGDQFAGLLLTGMDGVFAAREFPDAVIEVAEKRLCLTSDDLRRGERHYRSVEVDAAFGIREHWQHKFFPASSNRGPFMALLRWHPAKGVDFILRLINHACDWYGEQKYRVGHLEPAFTTTLGHGEDGELKQWASPRLWGLYRGLSVGPYVLQTALMALEQWLLEMSQSEGTQQYVEGWLRKLLRESNNVAVTAVVASVCTAATEAAGTVGLSLLTSRDLIQMDRARMAGEYSLASGFGDLFPMYDAEKAVYDNERQASSKLPHRKYDLEMMAINLQLTHRRDQVWEIIDQHLADLPPLAKQSDDDRLWRLALHRMDMRKYVACEADDVPGLSEEEKAAQTEKTEVSGQKMVFFTPSTPDGDIQEVIKSQEPIDTQANMGFSLFHWGSVVWRGDESQSVVPEEWHAKLTMARSQQVDDWDLGELVRGAPGLIAAVCVRDHWGELGDDDRQWCLDTLVDAVQVDADSKDLLVQMSKSDLSPSRPAAYVLSKALTHELSDAQRQAVQNGICYGLTHVTAQVAEYAAAGVGRYLATSDQAFCLRCVGCLAEQAVQLATRMNEEYARPYPERREFRDVEAELKPSTRSRMQDDVEVNEFDAATIDLCDWPGKIVAMPIMSILHHLPEHPAALAMFNMVATQLVSWWVQRDDHTPGPARRHRAERDFHFESDCKQQLASFVLHLPPDQAISMLSPIVSASDRHPREVEQFLMALVIAEDRAAEATCFWELWQSFADGMKSASWIGSVMPRSHECQLVHAIFLGTGWKKNVSDWGRLNGNESRVHQLFEDMPLSDVSLEAYCRFLNTIGSKSLPMAFKIVAAKLRDTPSARLTENTQYLLESMLRRFIYSEPFRLKQKRELRESVVLVLDHLVDAGSSAAYRMRDDFITPLTTIASVRQ
jgi:tRNA A37 threonylcarbamoyladenosine biosynthesis protein TsaE